MHLAGIEPTISYAASALTLYCSRSPVYKSLACRAKFLKLFSKSLMWGRFHESTHFWRQWKRFESQQNNDSHYKVRVRTPNTKTSAKVLGHLWYLRSWLSTDQLGPWWWSSGQRSRLLLRRPEFESCWQLKFAVPKNAWTGPSLKK